MRVRECGTDDDDDDDVYECERVERRCSAAADAGG